MIKHQHQWNYYIGLLGILVFSYPLSSQAQIIPDGSTPFSLLENVEIRGKLGDLIKEGSQVNNALFHSLKEFNITESQRVYFDNPVGVENILTRVTGGNQSQILGTLGVNGAANLYLTNEQGFIFGKNAQLDVEGAFTATTGNINLGDGQFFGKNTNIPNSILNIQVPLGLQRGTNQTGTIINRGQLQTDGDLTLAAQNIDLEGQIFAGKDLQVLGSNSVKIRDSETIPFIAASRGNLLIEGANNFDILALKHPDSGLFSLGNMTLRSNQPISGDTHYFSGGKFSIQDLSGNPGDLFSLYDPIISSNDDVVLRNYTGASLKVESKGSITTGNINIIEPDISLIDNPNDPDVAILKSSPSLILRSGLEELRSIPNISLFNKTQLLYEEKFEGGVGDEWSDQLTTTTPPAAVRTRSFLGRYSENDSVSLNLFDLQDHQALKISFELFVIQTWDGNDPSDGVDIWSLTVDGKKVLETTFSNHDSSYTIPVEYQSYTDQYDPLNVANNPPRLGASENNTLGYEFPYDNATGIMDSVYQLDFIIPHSKKSVEIKFESQLGGNTGLDDESWGIDDISVSTSALILPTKTTSKGFINSNQITTAGGPVIVSATDDINLSSINTSGGDIDIKTTGGDVVLGGSYRSGGGAIKIDSAGYIDTTAARIRTSSDTTGGDIQFTAEENILLGELRSASRNDGGEISLNTKGDVIVDGLFNVRSETSRSGVGGDINVNANSLILKNGARILTGSENGGFGGDINIKANLLEISGVGIPDNIPSAVVPTVISTTTGNEDDAGNINVDVKRLVVKDGATGIGTATVSSGQAGILTVNASESIELFGIAGALTPIGFSSDTVDINNLENGEPNINGDAGNIFVNTKRLIVRDGAVISSSTFNSGEGGNVSVKASELIELNGTSTEGFASGLYAQSFSTGNAGTISVNAPELRIANQATITARTATVKETNFPRQSPFVEFFGILFSDTAEGNAGDIDINVNNLDIRSGGGILASTSGRGDSGTINLTVVDKLFAQDGNIQTSSAQSSGDLINIRAGDMRLFGDSDITTSVFSGAGGGGDIFIIAKSILAFDDSDILAFARDGKGGNLFLLTPAFFGENYRPAPNGTDPLTLDFNRRVDVNASGAVNGLTRIPDVSFIDNSLSDLPDDLADSGTLLSRSCLAANAGSKGQFLMTGSGGLPVRPGDMSISYYSLEDIDSDKPTFSDSWDYGDPIEEPTGIYEFDGRLVMMRQCQ